MANFLHSMTLKETLYFALGTLKGLHANLDENGQYHIKDPIGELEYQIEQMDYAEEEERERVRKENPMSYEEQAKMAKGLLERCRERGDIFEVHNKDGE
jgi:hypothetical protein